METIMLDYKGTILSISKEVADLKGISHGHRITTDDEFWDIFSANSLHTISQLQLTRPIWENKQNKQP